MKSLIRSPFGRWCSLFALAVTLIAVNARPVGAQPKPPTDLPKVSLNPIVIAGHLRAAVLLEREALTKLSEGGGAPEIVPPAERAYILIRAARAGMIEARVASKFHDPLLDYQISRTTTAWNLARGPVDWSYDAMAPDVYLRKSGQNLASVIELLEEILLVLP
jgi:hypothetical protein